MFRKILFLTLTFSMMLTACFPIGSIQVEVETPSSGEQNPTPTDPATEVPSPIATDEPASNASTGTVTGKVCYPSEFIPPMTAYFRNTQTGTLSELTIAENQASFRVDLQPGTYEAFAYLENGEGGGSYSQAVACGLTVDCPDHSLITFDVQAGQTTPDIDLCDWYEPLLVPVNPKASVPVDPTLAGLVYENLQVNSIWHVGDDGVAIPVLADSDISAIVSPDGTQVLYFKNDDVWMGDLNTGTWRNLTNTPDRVEYPAAWIPGNDLVVLSSYGLQQDANGNFFPPDAIEWQLTFAHTDGSGYEVVDTDGMWGVPAVSSEGDLVAYDVSGVARLYRIGSGVEAFDPAQYGLTGVEKISAPAFSPDGSKLAWWVGGPLNGGNWQNAVAIFDLQESSYRLLHPYAPVSGEGFSNPIWNPNGEWIASQVIGDGERSALWVLKADGSNEINLGNGAYPVWSPSGNVLLYTLWPDNGGPAYEATTMRFVLSDQSITALNLPVGGIPLGWLNGQ